MKIGNFLLGTILIFLFISCDKNGYIEFEDSQEPIMTRVGLGFIDLSLKETTVYISWNQPFGNDVGISVEIYDSTSMGRMLGSFSSKEDEGQATIKLDIFDYHPYLINAVARVKALPKQGFSSEEMWVNVMNENSDPNDPQTDLCSHDYYFRDKGISLVFEDNLSACTIYHGMQNAGRLMFQLSVGQRTGPDMKDFDSETRMFDIYVPSTLENLTSESGKVTIPLSGFSRFDPNLAYMNCEFRLYHASCNKMSIAPNETFPQCTHYYKLVIPTQSLYPMSFGGSLTMVKKTNNRL